MSSAVAPLSRDCAAGHVCAPLHDRGVVSLRPLRRGEAGPLDEVFDGLSPRSRQRRYLVSMPRLPASFRRSLTAVDGRERVAWLALVEGRPAGIGRYVRTAPDSADIAFEVVDAHQGRGIGSALVDAVSTIALTQGVSWLEAVVERDNAASVSLLTRLGLRLTLDDGLLSGRGRLQLLDPSRVDRGAVLRLAAQVGDEIGLESPERQCC